MRHYLRWPQLATFGLLACLFAGPPAGLAAEAETPAPAPAPAAATPAPEVVAPTTNQVAAAPPAEGTIVTSEKLNVDYIHNLGTFEGNVLVVDPRISLRADKMVVHYGVAGTNSAPTEATARSLSKIEASGGVVITAQGKKSESDQAVYTAADGKIVLTGNPRVESTEGTVSGMRITFWRDDKRMDVESGTRLILYPEKPKEEETPKAEPKAPEGTKP